MDLLRLVTRSQVNNRPALSRLKLSASEQGFGPLLTPGRAVYDRKLL